MIPNNYIQNLISRDRSAIMNALLTKTMMISFKATSMVLFSLVTLFVFDAYAQQQGGSANSGDATGGAANAGGFTCAPGAFCTIYNTPQATGGDAASGTATGGAATAEEKTNPFSQPNIPSSNQPQELSGESSPNTYPQNFPSFDSFDESLGSQPYTQQQFSLNELAGLSGEVVPPGNPSPSLSTSNGNMSSLDGDMSRLHQPNQEFQTVNEKWNKIFGTLNKAHNTSKIGTDIRV
jgi:hypothetical protein